MMIENRVTPILRDNRKLCLKRYLGDGKYAIPYATNTPARLKPPEISMIAM
jgi:hypothetical protein